MDLDFYEAKITKSCDGCIRGKSTTNTNLLCLLCGHNPCIDYQVYEIKKILHQMYINGIITKENRVPLEIIELGIKLRHENPKNYFNFKEPNSVEKGENNG